MCSHDSVNNCMCTPLMLGVVHRLKCVSARSHVQVVSELADLHRQHTEPRSRSWRCRSALSRLTPLEAPVERTFEIEQQLPVHRSVSCAHIVSSAAICGGVNWLGVQMRDPRVCAKKVVGVRQLVR